MILTPKHLLVDIFLARILRVCKRLFQALQQVQTCDPSPKIMLS